MPTRLYSSISVETTLASNINSSVTSMQVATGTASTLLGGVTIVANSQFTVALDPDTINEEIVFITAGPSGDTFTITRGRAGSSAVAHSTGATIKHVLTSDDLTAFAAGISPVTSLGFSGSTSGTTTVQATAIAGTNTLTLPATTSDTLAGIAATQTLTNKTISASSNTLTGVATLTGTETLTNKTLTSPVLTTPSISTIDAKGDLLAGTADNTIGRLAVGANDTVLTADSSTATGLKWAAPAGGGKVLQVIQDTLVGLIQSTSTTYADTGLTVSITPSSASSKVLIMANIQGVAKTAGNSQTRVKTKLLRGSTTLSNAERTAYTNADGTLDIGTQDYIYLDSPATTSATTYKIQYASGVSGQTIYINDYASTDDMVSTIIVMEIGA